MERTPQTSNVAQLVGWVLLLTIMSGCETPLVYHFKHYHGPFAAIADSNKTYFHSQQTGRIIEKDPCATYCEPGCFGYEPTSWTHWPSECPSSCPVFNEVVSDEPIPMGDMMYPEVSDGTVIMDGVQTVPPQATQQQAEPDPNPATYIDEIRVPSIPADIESAIPSPSDATQSKRPVRIAPVEEEVEVAHKLIHDQAAATLGLSVSENSMPAIRKITPPKQQVKRSMGVKPISTSDVPAQEVTSAAKPKPENRSTTLAKIAPPASTKSLETVVLDRAPISANLSRTPAIVAKPSQVNPEVIAPIKSSMKKRPVQKTVTQAKKGSTAIATKELPKENPTKRTIAPVQPPMLKGEKMSASKRTVTAMRISTGATSTLRFLSKPSYKTARMSTIANDSDVTTTLRFR